MFLASYEEAQKVIRGIEAAALINEQWLKDFVNKDMKQEPATVYIENITTNINIA